MRLGIAVVASLAVSGLVYCGGGAPPPPPPPPGGTGESAVLGANSAGLEAPLPPSADAGPAPAASVDAPPASSGPPVTVLAKGLHGSSALAVDKLAAYWIDESEGDVQKAPKHGGVTMVVVPGNGNAFAAGVSVAVDNTDVYWTSGLASGAVKTQTLSRQDKNGGKPTVVSSAGAGPLQCVVLDDLNMYWVQGSAVMRAAKSGGMPLPVAGGQAGADCVAVDDASLYWSISGTEKAQFADGSIVAASKKGGGAKVLVKGAEHATNVLVDDKNVYWQNVDKIMKAPKTGGAEAVLAPAGGPIGDIAIDGGFVYFTLPGTGTDGAVGRVSKDGGQPTVLASGQSMPAGIAVDATSVYWTCKGTAAAQFKDGSVSRVDKP
jgi:hypothetical protein